MYLCRRIKTNGMFIHEKDHWTDFVWDKEKVTEKLMQVSEALGYMHGRLSLIGLDEQLKATAESITEEVVSTSQIEGISLNAKSVRSSVARRLGVPADGVAENISHDVEGIVSVELDATHNFKQPLSEETLFGWHNELFPVERRKHYQIDVGQYRTHAMQVVSGNMGRERVHYEAPTASRVPEEMGRFIAWYNDNHLKASPLKAAIAHFWFVCIHPFDDGNGRLARALSDRLLALHENSQLRYYSMSSQILADRDNYYRELERAQRGTGDITDWIVWFLSTLHTAIQTSDSVIGKVLQKSYFWQIHAGKPYTERQKRIMNFYLDGYDGKLTAKNWAKLADVSLDTANRDITDLVRKRMLRAVQGTVRNVVYLPCFEQDDGIPFENIRLLTEDKHTFIAMSYNGKEYREQLTEGDLQGLHQNERTLNDLAYKYFAYLVIL
jgi:Fic family protein